MPLPELSLPSWLEVLRAMLGMHIRSSGELIGFVLRITLLCVGIAVAVDVLNQLLFFESWAVALRSWAISAALALVIAAPISRAIGKAHLELYRAKQVVEKLSRTDPLTGLANRRALIEASDAPPPNALVLVIFDIDRFKRINDTHGHIAGDKVIQAVSQTMIDHLCPLGMLCRLGGEEFALLASGDRVEDVLDGVWAFADHLAAAPRIIDDTAVDVTISAGVAIRTPGGSFNHLYAEADRALYAAKAGGRNRVSYAEDLVAVGQQREGRRRWRDAIHIDETGAGRSVA